MLIKIVMKKKDGVQTLLDTSNMPIISGSNFNSADLFHAYDGATLGVIIFYTQNFYTQWYELLPIWLFILKRKGTTKDQKRPSEDHIDLILGLMCKTYPQPPPPVSRCAKNYLPQNEATRAVKVLHFIVFGIRVSRQETKKSPPPPTNSPLVFQRRT